MVDNVNEMTLKLANFLLTENQQLNMVSISGVIAYMTLSLITIGLLGPSKYELLDFLNCSYSLEEYSYPEYFLIYKCMDVSALDDFSKIGSVKTAIFHSKPALEYFKQIALESFDIDLQSIHSRNNEHQLLTIIHWSKTLKDVPFNILHHEPIKIKLSLLLISEYFIHFQWKTPFDVQSTKKTVFVDCYNNNRDVEIMRMVDYLRYYDDSELKAWIVFVALEDTDVFAAIVLPYYKNRLVDVLKKMSSKKMETWFHSSFPQRIDLRLPKFGFINKSRLRYFMLFHKLNSLFDRGEADFTNLVKDGGYINDYYHYSSIKINEYGSYNTTVRRSSLRLRGGSSTKLFFVSRPFIFYLYKSTNNLTLYFSVITQPLNYI
ncbi:Glia-derived nexin [Thelohanellus kitauei]|uniref:Glia-derived nexin n=1 Tax=Thelohanellus kitauei TaxID=669202 RepID=A0A0C2MG21_THEKT|nr:Glia-derived nexin [Thelohanellus kitauei]